MLYCYGCLITAIVNSLQHRLSINCFQVSNYTVDSDIYAGSKELISEITSNWLARKPAHSLWHSFGHHRYKNNKTCSTETGQVLLTFIGCIISSKYLGQLVSTEKRLLRPIISSCILFLILILTAVRLSVVPVEEPVSCANSVAAAGGFLLNSTMVQPNDSEPSCIWQRLIKLEMEQSTQVLWQQNVKAITVSLQKDESV